MLDHRRSFIDSWPHLFPILAHPDTELFRTFHNSAQIIRQLRHPDFISTIEVHPINIRGSVLIYEKMIVYSFMFLHRSLHLLHERSQR